MGTRSIWTIKDDNSKHHVYIHYDGYPKGAAEYLAKALGSGKIWDLPRFEADEFAAGFVAAIKDGGGNVRLANSRTASIDVEFGYTITHNGNGLRVKVTATDFWGDRPKERKLWEGYAQELAAWAENPNA